MAFLRNLALGSLLLLTGCVGQVQNTAVIYQPVSGVVDLRVTAPPGSGIVKVQFQQNDQVFAEDAVGPTVFNGSLDTSTLPSGVLVKVAAIGVRSDGSTTILKENFILAQSGTGSIGPQATASGTLGTATGHPSLPLLNPNH
jgi:hypothetical protein